MANKFPPIDPNQPSDIYIWEVYFYVNAPTMSMYSETYIREMGIPMSGDKKLDAELERAYQQTYLTIDKMVELTRRGYSIFVKDADTKVIYDYIQHHLQRQIEKLQSSYNVDEELIDDLIELDRLAAVVYPFARPRFEGIKTPSEFMNQLVNFGTNRTKFLAPFDPKKAHAKKKSRWDTPEEQQQKVEEQAVDPMEGHTSLSGELSNFLNRNFSVKPD